jgi:branched-chain amino acid aminotransferase
MRTKGAEFIWFDGRFVKWDEATVPIMTHALHYGTAVFEGIRAYASRNNLYIFKLNEHMKRLHHSASVYSIALNYTAKELCEATTQLLKKTGLRESCYIRPLTFVGLHGIDLNITRESPTHTAIIIFPLAKYFKEEGIKACVSSWRRIHDTAIPPMAKAAGNYLNSILATQESKRNGYDESILLDRDGYVSEASGENIFLVRNNNIYTPSIASSALEGITRDTAITIAKYLGYKVKERSISRTELYIADEIFLTGTAAEIIAVTSIDHRTIGNGIEGSVTKSIREKYSEIVSANVEGFMSWLTPVWQ